MDVRRASSGLKHTTDLYMVMVAIPALGNGWQRMAEAVIVRRKADQARDLVSCKPDEGREYFKRQGAKLINESRQSRT